MKALTIRNIPPVVARLIRDRAKESGQSLNRVVISLLEECAGLKRSGQQQKTYHDLDAFFGTWEKKDAEQFLESLAEQRTVDEELWK